MEQGAGNLSVVASAMYFCSLLGKPHSSQEHSLNKVIKKAGSIIGCKPDSFEVLLERRTLNNLLSVMDNSDHPPHHLLDRQRRQSTLTSPLSK